MNLIWIAIVFLFFGADVANALVQFLAGLLGSAS